MWRAEVPFSRPLRLESGAAQGNLTGRIRVALVASARDSVTKCNPHERIVEMDL